jgi:hypothetical protein
MKGRNVLILQFLSVATLFNGRIGKYREVMRSEVLTAVSMKMAGCLVGYCTL